MYVAMHINDADLGEAFKSYVERRLRFALGRFGGRVGQVTVRIGERKTAAGSAPSCCPSAALRLKKATPTCSLPLIGRRGESVACSVGS